MKTIVLVLLLVLVLLFSASAWAGGDVTWVFSSSGNLAQMTQPIPKGYGYPRGSILSMSLAGEEVIGTLTGKNGKTLCTLQGVYTDCSIIDGCGTIGPALSTCGK